MAMAVFIRLQIYENQLGYARKGARLSTHPNDN
jgi:hypothetical protein